jgi:cysteine synthase B
VSTPQYPAQPALTLVPRAMGETITDRIGNTPLLRIRLFEDECPDVAVYAKAEFLNPGGSVKDRPALRMIEDGERSGRLVRGRIILDSTSGNTGIAYAMIGAAKGYRVRLVMPGNVSEERRQLVTAFGAEVEYSDPLEGSDGAIRLVRAMYDENPDAFFMPDQYNNDANWLAHYDGTGAEIWEQTRGTVTHFVAALGTSGTFMGVTRRLKEMNPDVQCISVQPAEPWHGLEGLKHMETSIVPGIYDASLADEDIGVETEPAYDLARELARTEGILAGHSSGPRGCAANRPGCRRDGAPRRRRPLSLDGSLPAARALNLRFATIAPAAEHRIRDLAAAAYPHEGCGVLLGRRDGTRGRSLRPRSRRFHEGRSRRAIAWTRHCRHLAQPSRPPGAALEIRHRPCVGRLRVHHLSHDHDGRRGHERVCPRG